MKRLLGGCSWLHFAKRRVSLRVQKYLVLKFSLGVGIKHGSFQICICYTAEQFVPFQLSVSTEKKERIRTSFNQGCKISSLRSMARAGDRTVVKFHLFLASCSQALGAGKEVGEKKKVWLIYLNDKIVCAEYENLKARNTENNNYPHSDIVINFYSSRMCR